MKKIFKYNLAVTDIQEVSMPIDAQILSVQEQHGEVCLWALVNREGRENNLRTIRMFGTGHDISESKLKFIGTVQQNEGHLVWHVFEEIKT